jgi:response regulator RpfG family c-di-GMP phosphodiesterase
VDSFDAMKTIRPYHNPLSAEEIFQELQSGSGTLYDPNLLANFIGMIKKKDVDINKSVSLYTFF